jgi:hypothetical protein
MTAIEPNKVRDELGGVMIRLAALMATNPPPDQRSAIDDLFAAAANMKTCAEKLAAAGQSLEAALAKVQLIVALAIRPNPDLKDA